MQHAIVRAEFLIIWTLVLQSSVDDALHALLVIETHRIHHWVGQHWTLAELSTCVDVTVALIAHTFASTRADFRFLRIAWSNAVGLQRWTFASFTAPLWLAFAMTSIACSMSAAFDIVDSVAGGMKTNRGRVVEFIFLCHGIIRSYDGKTKNSYKGHGSNSQYFPLKSLLHRHSPHKHSPRSEQNSESSTVSLLIFFGSRHWLSSSFVLEYSCKLQSHLISGREENYDN